MTKVITNMINSILSLSTQQQCFRSGRLLLQFSMDEIINEVRLGNGYHLGDTEIKTLCRTIPLSTQQKVNLKLNGEMLKQEMKLKYLGIEKTFL